MRRAAALALALSLVLAGASGCHHHRFVTGVEAGGVRVQEWQHVWLFGRIPGRPFDLEYACGRGTLPAEFGSYVSVTNALAGAATLGLYAPRTAYAVCPR